MGLIMHKGVPYGGGIDAIADASDVEITTPSDGDVLEYDGTEEKWVNGQLATVAKTGAYSDLSGKPTIPTVNNGTLTIQKNGTGVATFTANQSGNSTANISVPTKTSDLTNDSNFATEDDVAEATEVESLPNTTPYLYRQSPAIGSRVMENALVGASVVKNQLVQNGNFASKSNWTEQNCSYTVSGNVATFLSTANGGRISQGISVVSGRRYYASVEMKLTTATTSVGTAGMFSKSCASTTEWQRLSAIVSFDTSGTSYFVCIDNRASGWDNVLIRNAMCIDLTQWFGSSIADNAYTKEQATAGSGIAWLKSQGFDFSKYIPYNTGTLESVNPSGKKVVGKNLCFLGAPTTHTVSGVSVIEKDNNVILNGTATSAGMIDFQSFTLQKGDYVLSIGAPCPSSVWISLSNKGFIMINPSQTQVAFTINEQTELFLHIWVSNGVAFNNFILNPIVRFASVLDTTYEPYTTETYSIYQSPLRGVPQLVNDAIVYDGDERRADGSTDRKYGIVDLGSLAWSSDSTYVCFFAKIPDGKPSANYITPMYKNIGLTTNADMANADNMSLGYGTRDGVINLKAKNTAYSSAASFKTAMSGVYLVYEKDAVTTESLPPFDNPQKSFVGGTEEWLTDNDVPVGHQSEYKALPVLFDDDYIQTIAERAENAASKVTPYLKVVDNNTVVDLHKYQLVNDTDIELPISNLAELLNSRFLQVELLDYIDMGGYIINNIIGSAFISVNSIMMEESSVMLYNNGTDNMAFWIEDGSIVMNYYDGTGTYQTGADVPFYLTIRLVD